MKRKRHSLEAVLTRWLFADSSPGLPGDSVPDGSIRDGQTYPTRIRFGQHFVEA